jgi:hypothetical protein
MQIQIYVKYFYISTVRAIYTAYQVTFRAEIQVDLGLNTKTYNWDLTCIHEALKSTCVLELILENAPLSYFS